MTPGSAATRMADEVLAHLNTLPGARARITLEVEVSVPDGIADDVIRIVSENAATLRCGHGGV